MFKFVCGILSSDLRFTKTIIIVPMNLVIVLHIVFMVPKVSIFCILFYSLKPFTIGSPWPTGIGYLISNCSNTQHLCMPVGIEV